MTTLLQEAIRASIATAPQAAIRQMPQILDFYITNLEKLNLVYLAAKRLQVQPDKFAWELLDRAIQAAEQAM